MLYLEEVDFSDIELVPDLLRSKKLPFFLDSGEYFQRIGRYSFWSYEPVFSFYFKDGNVFIDNEIIKEDPFQFLKRIFNRFKRKYEKIFPFHCGWVGYFSYELGNYIEKLPDSRLDDYKIPEYFFSFYDLIFAYDHIENKTYLTGIDIGISDFERKFLKFKNDLKNLEEKKVLKIKFGDKFISNFNKSEYLEAIQKAREYIYKGDIYQVNLSQRFRIEFNGDPYYFYKIFRKLSPAPFAAFLDFGDFQILSNSPERYLYINGKHIETRPIKGTRKRGKNLKEDRRLIEELRDSEKDKAEHLMIVDLERNDLGRIAQFNSVKVSEFEIIETYANVHHMVSTVEAIIDRKFDCIDCIRNSYPGGSITGAPKIRAMEIIDELEPTYRSVYTGSIGYIDISGDIDFNIAIRTAILKDGFLNFQVGGGIVYDSDPEEEYIETIVKADSFFKTVKELAK